MDVVTGMPFAKHVRWNEDSSLLAGLYMLIVSVNFQLYGDFNSEFDWEELIFVAWSKPHTNQRQLNSMYMESSLGGYTISL